MNAAEQRSGEDRRAENVTHRDIWEKQMAHDRDILQIRNDLHDVKKDLHGVREELRPISQGITSMVFLFKIALALGALAGVALGLIELWQATQHVNDHIHGG